MFFLDKNATPSKYLISSKHLFTTFKPISHNNKKRKEKRKLLERILKRNFLRAP